MKTMKRAVGISFIVLIILCFCSIAQAAETFIEDGFIFKVLNRKEVEVVGYEGNDSEPYLSWSVNGYSVKGIADYAFRDNTVIKELSMGANLEYIGDYAFYHCLSLTEMYIPSSMKTIGVSAFEGCTNLKDITFWSGESIGKNAFKGCINLTDISIPSEMKTIGDYAFEGCVKLKDVTLWSAETIGKGAFRNCSSLTDISIPSETKTIGEYAFEGCVKLKDVTLWSVETIGKGAFKNCSSLTDISFPSETKIIGESSFEGCSSLERITFWGGEKIEKYAFRNCVSLTSISLPSEMKSVGESAFEGCSSLTKYSSWNDNVVIGKNAFAGCPLSTGNKATTSQQTSSAPETTTDDNIEEQDASFNLQLHIDFIPNIFFSTYDVELIVDGTYEATLSHGEDADFSLTLSEGIHTIGFANEDSSSVKGEVELEINSDIDAELKISCYSDKVSVETIYIDRLTELAEGEVKMDVAASSYLYKPYQDVTTSLEALGFTNIKYSILYDIVFGFTDAGDVDSVSIAGNKDFKRADVFPADAEIIITYHMPEEDNPSLIKMQKSSSAYDGMNYQQVEKSFKDMGFTNIQLGKVTTELTSYSDGEVFLVQIKGSSFYTGETFKPDDKVYIKYYHVEAPVVVENITIENNSEFAALMKITNQNDATTIRQFVNSHIGDTIEFDGCIALMMRHENYKTRFDVAMVGGNYHAARVYGPMFAFEDVNFSDMHVSGTDTVAEGMNFHITAEIKGYNAAGGYIHLKPVSLKVRDASTLKDDTQLTVKVVSDSVYLRNKAGGSIVLMSKGSSVIIYGYDKSVDMFQAKYGDKEGYVKGAGFSISRNELLDSFR